MGNRISACRAGGALELTHLQHLLFLQWVASRSWGGRVVPGAALHPCASP